MIMDMVGAVSAFLAACLFIWSTVGGKEPTMSGVRHWTDSPITYTHSHYLGICLDASLVTSDWAVCPFRLLHMSGKGQIGYTDSPIFHWSPAGQQVKNRLSSPAAPPYMLSFKSGQVNNITLYILGLRLDLS